MARRVARGEIWSYRSKAPDKRRPVLVLSRLEVIPLLHTVMVAPVTSTRRGAPSEVHVGVDEGLKRESAVNSTMCRPSNKIVWSTSSAR